MINTHNGYVSEDGNQVPAVNVEHYPAIKDWLDNGGWNKKPSKGTNFERLAKRTDQGITPYNLRSLAYMDDFNRLKIVFSRISGNEPSFALDHCNMFTNDTGYIISGKNLSYLLDELTSSEIWFAFKMYYMGGGIEKEFKVNNLLNLPVPLPGKELVLSSKERSYIESQMIVH